MIPTTPWPPECMWTCRTSTVCLLPRGGLFLRGFSRFVPRGTKATAELPEPSENWAERAARLAGTRWLYSVVRPSGPSTISVAPASYGPSTAAGFSSCIANGQ